MVIHKTQVFSGESLFEDYANDEIMAGSPKANLSFA